jgi:hypothetical protein
MGLGLRSSAALIAALLALGSASAAAAEATPIAGLGWEIKLAAPLRNHLFQDCFLDLQRGGPDPDRPWYVASDRAAGSWDPTVPTWSVAGRGPGVLLDSFTQVQQHTGHAWAIDKVGFALRGGRVDITAEIRSAASRTASVTRRRIAVIAHPRIRPRIVHRVDRKGKDLGPLPNTFVIDIRGKATVAPAFVAATRRWRCRGRLANNSSGHVRRGEALGQVQLDLQPSAATGLGGTLTLSSGAQFSATTDSGDEVPVAVGATGSAIAVTEQLRGGRVRSLRFPVAAGSRTALQCERGQRCLPVQGGFPLGGGAVLTLGPRSTTVGDLAVSWSRAGNEIETLVTGTVDGQALTIARGRYSPDYANPLPFVDPTDEFLAAIGAVLGAPIKADLSAVLPEFTATGPA